MDTFAQSVIGWLRQPDYEDQDKNLTALYIQFIVLTIIAVTAILGLVYAVVGQVNYVIFLLVDILIQTLVIVLIRYKKLQSALSLFLIAALVLLSLGVFSGGGIHASSALLYPVVLLFASLLLDRKSYITYVGLCIASIGLIIYAEHQKLTPVYVPDAPELPLFLSVGLIVLSAAFISRFITENLQNSIRRSRQYAQVLSNQKAMLDRVGQAVVGCTVDDTIIYWNHAALNLYGWKTEEVVGPLFGDLDMAVDQLELTGRGSWVARLDTGAEVELGRGTQPEVLARTNRFLRTLTQVTARYNRRPDAVESADLRHPDGYALRLRGVSTVVGSEPKK